MRGKEKSWTFKKELGFILRKKNYKGGMYDTGTT